MSVSKFDQCVYCVNQDLDPVPCRTCKKASNFEPETSDIDAIDDEPMSYGEFLMNFRQVFEE